MELMDDLQRGFIVGLIGAAVWLSLFPRPARAQCVGDCDGNGEVTINELIRGVDIARNEFPASVCPIFDVNADSVVTVNELVQAVHTLLNAQALHVQGSCLQPGETESLVPCAPGTPVRVFQCTDASRCLHDSTALTMVTTGLVGVQGRITLTSCTLAKVPLVFEAELEAGVKYRVIDFGLLVANGGVARVGSVHGAALDSIVLSPVTEATVRLVDDNGLQNFNGAGVQQIGDAVQQANADISFAGQDAAAAATLATDTAASDPTVQQVIETNKLHPFVLQLVGGGPRGTDPVSGVRVLRHDLTTGAVLADRVTDAGGIVNFGDVGADRTTISIATSDSTHRSTITFVDFPTGPFSPASPFTFSIVDRIERPPLVTLDATLTPLPAATNHVDLYTGDFTNAGTGSSGSSADISNFEVDKLQSDGTFSLLAVAQDSTRVARGCGSLLDIDPANLQNNSVTFAANSAPTAISFNASEPVATDLMQILRRGAIFEVDLGADTPVTFGTVNTCALPGADAFALEFKIDETPSTSSRYLDTVFPALPGSVDVTMPSLSIGTLTRSADGGTVTWSRSGADLGQLDLGFVEFEWRSGDTKFRWTVVGDPARTSFTLPVLPADLSDRVPPTTAGVRIDLAGLDTANGFDDLVGNLSAAGGNFDILKFNSTVFSFVERTRPVVAMTKDGAGSGTVFSSPAGIDCGATCAANFAPGLTVTLTAVADAGSTFGGWSGDCEGASTQTTIFTNDNYFCTATFDALPPLRKGHGL
jgi:List-Bact-rpt repeat protein